MSRPTACCHIGFKRGALRDRSRTVGKGVMRSLIAVLALVTIAACAGSPTSNAATASSVSVQPGDLPTGMQRCDLSGDINAYLDHIKTTDPATYTSTKNQ